MFPTEQIVDPQGPVEIKWQIVQRHAHYLLISAMLLQHVFTSLFTQPLLDGPRWLLAEGNVETPPLVLRGYRSQWQACASVPASILDRPHRIRGFGSFIVLHSNSQWREGSDLVIPLKIG